VSESLRILAAHRQTLAREIGMAKKIGARQLESLIREYAEVTAAEHRRVLALLAPEPA
jgi:hypothetical protein